MQVTAQAGIHAAFLRMLCPSRMSVTITLHVHARLHICIAYNNSLAVPCAVPCKQQIV